VPFVGRWIMYARLPDGTDARQLGEPYVATRNGPLHPEWDRGQYDIVEPVPATPAALPRVEAPAGMHISTFAKRLVEQAPVRAVFNSIEFDVAAGDSVDAIQDHCHALKMAQERATPCNCDQALALKAQVREMAGHLGELLALMPATDSPETNATRDAARVCLSAYLAKGGA